MVQTSLKHQEKPSENFIYSPLLHIMTNRPPCRHDRLEAGCGDPYKVETHHALVYRSIVSGPPALLQQLGYLHSIHYWARASNCFGLFAGEHRNSRHTRVLSRARVTPCLRRGRHLSRLAACSASPLLLLDTCSMQCTNIINNPTRRTIRTRNTDYIYFFFVSMYKVIMILQRGG